MWDGNRITILKLLWFIALVAVVVQQGMSWVSLVVLQLLLVTAIVELLMVNFPTALKQQANANYVRLDGSISQRRKRVETGELTHFRYNLIYVLSAFCFLTSALIWCGNTERGRELLGLAAQSSTVTTGVVGTGTHEVQLKPTHQAPAVANHRLVMVMILLLVWIVACFFVFKFLYFWMLKDFSIQATHRSNEYRLQDMGRMSEESAVEPTQDESFYSAFT